MPSCIRYRVKDEPISGIYKPHGGDLTFDIRPRLTLITYTYKKANAGTIIFFIVSITGTRLVVTVFYPLLRSRMALI